MTTISAVVITKNEEQMVANCIDTLRWCHEVIVVDSGSEDSTVGLAKQAGAKVFELSHPTFAQSRNKGKAECSGDWILYIDADERVTPKLRKEIEYAISNSGHVAYSLPRNNIHYGKWMQHGGWETDKIVRLFHKDHLVKWEGDVHEHALVDGSTGILHEPLVHLTHRNMKDGLQKSMIWTDIEARLLYEAHHPKVTILRLLKVVVWDFIKRVFLKKAWKDGQEGMIEAMVQSMNRFLVYERLWELQRKPSLEETYKHIEKEVATLWKKENA